MSNDMEDSPRASLGFAVYIDLHCTVYICIYVYMYICIFIYIYIFMCSLQPMPQQNASSESQLEDLEKHRAEVDRLCMAEAMHMAEKVQISEVRLGLEDSPWGYDSG